MTRYEVDTTALRAEFDVCGACDYGVPVGCSCSSRDPRAVISELCDEIDRLRAASTEALLAHAAEMDNYADADETSRAEERAYRWAAKDARERAEQAAS
jgi:hypothetical protein